MYNTPIVVINRDRLTTTVKLINRLLGMGYTSIHIADMDSSYTPLLDWYKTVNSQQEGPVTIWYFPNWGQKGIWEKGFLKREFSHYSFVAVTDSDIELDPDTPNDFIGQMVTVAKDYRIDKVGLSIRFTDITNPVLKQIISPIEGNYWKNKLQHPKYNMFSAPVDTTFCIVKPELPFQYHALRIADWPIIHTPWYEDWNNLSEEDQYYMSKADAEICTTKQHYLKYLATK